MSDAAVFLHAREAFIERLMQLVAGDARIAACWLQGSLADGSADALSDVDAYLAVPDGEFDAVYAERRALVARLGPVYFLSDLASPRLKAVNAVLAGPVKLDLFFERLSEAPAERRPAVRMLVDKAELGPRLVAGWEPPLDMVAAMVRSGFAGSRQGALWPMRLLLRGQWATYANIELRFINENLAAMMAVGVYPRLLFKNPFTVPRLLRPEQQAELQALTDAVLDGVLRRDAATLRDAHLRAYAAFVREGRAALAALGLPYPGTDEGDAGLRALYEQHWPLQPPATSWE